MKSSKCSTNECVVTKLTTKVSSPKGKKAISIALEKARHTATILREANRFDVKSLHDPITL